MPLAVGGGIVGVVVVGLLATGVFSDDTPAAGGGTTTSAAGSTTLAPGTTTVVTTTTAPATTTTQIATTTTAATTTITSAVTVLHDGFEGSTQAVAMFGPEYMDLTVANGRGRLRASQGDFVLPAMYPISIGEATIEMNFRLNLVDPLARAGLLVFAEDPGDGAITHYVLVEIEEATASLVITPFSEAGFGADTRVPLPAAANFDPDGFNDLVVVLASDGGIGVILNDEMVTTWAGPAPATEGWFGLVVSARGPDDVLVVEDLLVTG